MINKLALVLCFVFSIVVLHGQNGYFTQFDMSPLSVNPALTGDFKGRLRLNANMRDQWSQLLGINDYDIGQVSADTKLKLSEQTELGIGVLGNISKAGSLDFTVQEYVVSTALHRYIGDRSGTYHKISLGLNGGIGQRSLLFDEDSQGWPNENGEVVVGEPPIMPPDIDYDFVYPILSSGLSWSWHTLSGATIQAGVAAYGLNRPNISFSTANEVRRKIFWSMFGQAEIPVGKKGSIIPALYYVKAGSQDQLSFGSFGRYYFKEVKRNRFIQVGVFSKTVRQFPDINIVFGQVSAALLRVQWDAFTIGASFDFHKLHTQVPTYEFSLGYILGEKQVN